MTNFDFTLCALPRFLMSIFVLGAGITAASPVRSAEWTVMIYMNGKNNLEPDAINNFYSMANVGSSDQVNVVAELGRPRIHYTNSDGKWSGVLRFYLRKGTKPIPAEAISDPSKEGQSTDMGSPQALSEFIDWSKAKYPANRYMLIIWNHGQGWRFQMAADRAVRTIAARAPAIPADSKALTTVVASVPPLNGYRSVSLDEDTRNILFNSDIQGILEARFSTRKLDLFGFDACLMSMIETAYAFRKTAAVMVASEELEPGEGWQYEGWIRALIAQPSLDARGLAKSVVESYRERYGNSFLTTLSAIDLEQVNKLASSVSALGRLLTDRLSAQKSPIRSARRKLTTYGSSYNLKTSIDLDYFLESYGRETKDPDVLAALKQTRDEIDSTVLANYASTRDISLYGSRGIAIYFPASRADFLADRDHGGYLKSNLTHPVEFVMKEAWSDFLAAYLK